MKGTMDYSLYLVTDLTALNCEDVVQQAVDNGCTLVQLREKTMDTGALIAKAQRIHKITSNAGIPLLINDRVDVCLAMGAEGVHIGQDDMPPAVARQLLGPDKIIGVTVHSLVELQAVLDDGIADYIGMGPVYPTGTKKMKDGPIGVQGAREFMRWMDEHDKFIPNVLISGVNEHNCIETIEQSQYNNVRANGVAVVSCISKAKDPGAVTRLMRTKLDALFHTRTAPSHKIKSIRQNKPLIHHITNTVVQNFSANVTLALGASPLMARECSEFKDLSHITNSALVINTGHATVGDTTFAEAMDAYKHKHTVYDPVGMGATTFRREFNTSLFAQHVPTVVKANVGEIITLIGSAKQASVMRGVDSMVELSATQLKQLVMPFLERYPHLVIVITGVTDYVCSKGDNFYAVTGGSELMTRVTGTGCSLSSVIASFIAQIPLENQSEIVDAVVDAVACYKHCAKVASLTAKGPGTFAMALLDALESLEHVSKLDCKVFTV